MNAQTISTVLTALALVAVVVGIFVVLHDRRSDGDGVKQGLDEVTRRIGDLDKTILTTQTKLETQVTAIDKNLDLLKGTVDSREGALKQQVTRIDEQMGQIASGFTNDRARGGWGELSLRRLFELAGLTEGRDFTMQFDAGDTKPDALVRLPGSRNIVIDAKFSIARFNDALAAENPQVRDDLLRRQAKDLEKDARSLNNKGYKDLASGGYIVMYLPSQAVWEAAAAADPDLLHRLIQLRVIVAGPNALHALLLTAGSLLAEHRFVEEAQQVLYDARELHKRLEAFIGHFGKVGKSLETAVNSFNDAIGSWDRRLIPHINQMAKRAALDPSMEMGQITSTVREAPPRLDEAVHSDETKPTW